MKKPLILLSIAIGILLCSCSDDIETVGNDLLTPEPVATTLQENNRVNINAIVALNQDSVPDSRSSDNILQRIECIKGQSNDTCLYVYKKEKGGWTMYSTDTRVPPILAQSDSGSFENLMRIDAARLWIQSMAEDLAIIKRLPDTKLKFSQKEIEDNKNFWKSISEPDEFVRQSIDVGGIDTTRLIPRGHYELRRTLTYTEILKSVDNLTLTRWHQGDPYNRCCPYRTDREDERVPVGCVPIAAAQVLFYLHYHLGVPETAPSKGSCVGDILSSTFTISDFNSEIWDIMKTDNSAAAPFLAYCGRLIGVKYGNVSSSSSTSDLKDKLFAPCGISCSYDSLVPSVLISNLLAKLPVILKAQYDSKINGHAFIADRYRSCRTVTVNNYVWVYDNPASGATLPVVPDRNEYVYISPATDYIGMNWGWGEEAYDTSEWFSLTGDWISSYKDMSGKNWIIDRYMVHDFEVIND